MKTKAEEICKQNAAKLTEYLKKEETMKKMFRWHGKLNYSVLCFWILFY